MIREVELVSYLPPFMQDYKEPVEALRAENPEFHMIWREADRLLYNRFISTADERGIARFEKLLKICPKETDTLEIRRMRIQSRWYYRLPYTIKVLTEKIKIILNETYNFSVWTDFSDGYELILIVYATDDSQVEELKYLLSLMIPENIVVNIIYESPLVGGFCYGGTIKEADIIELRQR